MGRDPHPLAAYRQSGYYEKISAARVGGESQGVGIGIFETASVCRCAFMKINLLIR